MKSIYTITFGLALCLLVSCSSGDDEPGVIVPQDATLTLSVAPGSVQTKGSFRSTDPLAKTGEARINNICAALFKEDGSLLTTSYVDYSGTSGETPDTIRINAKSNTQYTYVILVNVGNQGFANLDKLKEATYELKDIRVDNQPMCSQFMTVTLNPGANYIGPEGAFTHLSTESHFIENNPVLVYRTASRIDFEKIAVDWSEDDASDLLAENARFRLKRLYVTNAKSATYLVGRTYNENKNSVELTGTGVTYLNGKESTSSDYFAGLDLFTGGATPPIITPGVDYTPQNDAQKWQCYVTENTETSSSTTLILKGDIIHAANESPILENRYYFIPLLNMKEKDTNKELAGVIRNYVIRISATVTGKGSGDEEYRENAYATVEVIPEAWTVERQHEDVN